jgi:hypothetical protein
MKTAHVIAKTLLDRCNSMSPIVMQGEMLNALGSDGLQEALNLRWLVPDNDTGYLYVSQDMSKVIEMREAVENAPKEEKEGEKEDKDEEDKKKEWTKPWERPNESRTYSMQHSHRPLNELLSPGTGHDPARSTPTAPAAAPAAAPVAATSARPAPPAAPMTPAVGARPGGAGKPGVGDEVVIVSKGGVGATESQTFSGKVSSSLDGKVRINFGGTEREFPESEVQVLKKATATA